MKYYITYTTMDGADNNQQKTIVGGEILTLILSLQEFKIGQLLCETVASFPKMIIVELPSHPEILPATTK